MQSRVLWIYAAVLTAALVVAFVEEGGLAAGSGKVVVLALDVGLVWAFAGLAVKARILAPRPGAVRELAGAEPRRQTGARGEIPDTGVFARPQVGRL